MNKLQGKSHITYAIYNTRDNTFIKFLYGNNNINFYPWTIHHSVSYQGATLFNNKSHARKYIDKVFELIPKIECELKVVKVELIISEV
jgi:hypothetical protein